MRRAIRFAFLTLYGCASAPSYRSPAVPPPTSYRGVAGSDSTAPEAARPAKGSVDHSAEVSVAYWDQLGDTTLSRLVKEVARANLDVQAARARLNAARADRTRASLDLVPTASFYGDMVRQRFSTYAFPGGSGVYPDQTTWDAGLTGSWDLDVFGRIRHTVQAPGALVQVAEEGLRDAQLALTAQLAATYFGFRGAQEQLEVARRNAENQRHTYDVTKERLTAGRGNAFDTDRAQAQLSSTLASIPLAEAAVAAAQYRIGVLVGRSPIEVARELDNPGKLPGLPDSLSVPSPDAVVQNRPDVAAAERLAAAQGALVGAAKASYLPTLAIAGSAGYTAPDFGTLGDVGTRRYAIGPVVTWPALSLGRVKAEVDAARARANAAQAEYSRIVLSATEDVANSLTRYRSARRRVEALADASAASERAAELARLRFREGVTDFLQVLDAERTELEAQDRLVQGRVDAGAAYAALYQAMGGR